MEFTYTSVPNFKRIGGGPWKYGQKSDDLTWNDPSVKITLFRSFCTSLYTCELWCQYRSESLRKLCVAYNNVFRFLCREPRNCSASHMFVSRGLPTCNMLIRKSIYAFMTSTKRSCNTILQNIVGSDHIYTSRASASFYFAN